MPDHTIIVPAYGRDYKSKKEVIEAFTSGKDFIVCNAFDRYDGKAVNQCDLLRARVYMVQIRYYKRQRVVVATLKQQSGYEPKYIFA